MKKFLVAILIIVIVFPLIVGGLLWFTYNNTDEDTIPLTPITILDTQLSPVGYEWHTPVFGGMMYKDFYETPPPELENLGTVEESSIDIEPPSGFSSTATLSLEGQDVWTGQAEDISEYVFLDSGQYEVRVDSYRESETGKGYGSLQYRAAFSAVVDIRLEASAENVAQGDVLAIQLYNLPEGSVPTTESWLSPLTFAQNGNGRMTAYIAAAYDTEPGAYNVQISVDDRSWDVPFNVVEAQFPEQELTIDTSDEEIGEANSAAAYQEYNNTIPPLFELADDTIHWQGLFIQPTEGELTTEFGLFRYTNGDATPSRHAGIDISAESGTPVLAPNGGRVLFAEKLLNTGNTVVIEHGNGLKSLFYHMKSLDVAQGDMVQKGQQIGTVGTTGYSTGPHLHYEVRLYSMSIDPMRLFDGTSWLYAFEDQEALLSPEEEQTDASVAEPSSHEDREPAAAQADDIPPEE